MRTLILTAALLAPAAALASGDSVPNVNPRDLALAGAATAAQEGAPAVYGNPAALSRLEEGLHLSLAGTLLDNGTKWHGSGDVSPSPQSTKFHPAPPPALYAAWGGKIGERGFGVGVGMTIPEGGNVDFDPSWYGNTSIITVDRKVFGTYLSGGIEVLPQIRLGASAIWYRTTEYLSQAQSFVGSTGTAELSTVGDALTYGLSAEFRPLLDVPFTIGVDYKHKGDQKLTGAARFHDVPLALRPQAPDQDVTHYFTVPNSLSVGVAYQFPKVLLAGVWTLDRYKVYDRDFFEGSLGTTVLVQRNYGNGYVFRLGAEFTPHPSWKLRAGLLRDHTGMDASVWSPSLPDGDVWAGAVGASYKIGKGFAVDATLFVALYSDVTTTAADPYAPPGRWSTTATIYALGVSYHFNPGGVAQAKMP
jgi:long-chain fatty acid transport protein